MHTWPLLSSAENQMPTTSTSLKEKRLQETQKVSEGLEGKLHSCQVKLQEQACTHRKEVESMHLTVDELSQKLQQATTEDSMHAQQGQPSQQNTMNMVRS